MCFCTVISSHALLIWSYKLAVTRWQVFCCAVFFAAGRPTLFNLHNPPRRFGTGVCVYVGRARERFFQEGSETTHCAERCFSPRFGFDRENPAERKKKQIKGVHKWIQGVEKIHAFYLRCAFRISPGKTHVMTDDLKIICAGIKVKGSLRSTWSWLIDWILSDSLTLLLLKDTGRVWAGCTESWHIFSLLANGLRRVLLTCLTDAAPRGFHYKPSSFLKGLLY